MLEGVLPQNRIPLTDEKVKIEHVGYFRSAACDDFVFFLPKVVLESKKMPDGKMEDRVFCTKENEYGWSPEELINLDELAASGKPPLGRREKDFLYEFAVWIYRAIARFNETHSGADIIWQKHEKQSAGFRRRYVTNTLLDVILALIRFNRDNQDYFTFKVKERHSGAHRINWTRTISKTVAVIQNGDPLYLEPRTKKKAVNFDEELLVIFYSILDHVNRRYSFKARFNLGYELIPAAEFKRYLSGYGEVRLRQIKYKYFSDRDLALWELCFAFFHKAHKANVVSDGEEYLLAKNFNVVFETMIDELVGDAELARFKELSDGKEIDHLYVDESLTRRANRNTLYIADSKYYKVGEALSANGESVAKQFTYAKNMLQLNLNLFLPGESPSDVSPIAEKKRKPFRNSGIGLQRDSVTEGYDIIPNFFISANMSKEFSYEDPELEWRGHDKNGEFRNIHFENRLFDRDTLILAHYDINFLYVVSLYARNDKQAQEKWQKEVRETFRKRIQDLLGGKDENGALFRFRALLPHAGVDAPSFFHENFKYVVGKVLDPCLTVDGRPVYILALENPGNIHKDQWLSEERYLQVIDETREENEAVIALLETVFDIVPFRLGDDLGSKLSGCTTTSRVGSHLIGGGSPMTGMATSGVQIVSKVGGSLFPRVESTGLCPCPKDQCANPDSVKILVLPFTQGAHVFRVKDGCRAVEKSSRELTTGAEAPFLGVSFPCDTCWVWPVERIS